MVVENDSEMIAYYAGQRAVANCIVHRLFLCIFVAVDSADEAQSAARRVFTLI